MEKVITEATAQKKYRCPYCDFIGIKEDLIEHIELEHDDMIPQDHTPARIVFNIINKKAFGTCVVCKKETKWKEDTCKYARLCENPKCRETLSDKANGNMIKVYNKPTLLGDADHQQKMLASRGISGEYTFTDGGKRTYTGKNEMKTLQYFDKVIGASSKDIMSPGPVLEYKYAGESHKWITDIYYIPYNLVIEVKDGGDNPNKRVMPIYREKQVYKEKMITELGTFNYLRLTNNNFEQLITMLAELKYEMLEDPEDKKVLSRIHEEVSALPPANVSNTYVIQYGYNNVLSGDVEGFALSNNIISDKVLLVKDGKLVSESSEFLNDRVCNIYKYLGDKTDVLAIYKEVGKAGFDSNYIYNTLSRTNILCKDEIQYDRLFKLEDISRNTHVITSMTESLKHQCREILKKNRYLPLMKNSDIVKSLSILEGTEDASIAEDMNGYFAINTNMQERTISVKDLDMITESMIQNLNKGMMKNDR